MDLKVHLINMSGGPDTEVEIIEADPYGRWYSVGSTADPTAPRIRVTRTALRFAPPKETP